MSVLETFYILFKSDADKAADGLDKVDKAADRAEDSLQKTDRAAKSAATASGRLAAATAAADVNAKRLATSFVGVAKSIVAPLLAIASAGTLINLAVGRAANIRELDQFSSKLNSSISDVDAFQRSVQELGGEGAQALDSLVKLGEKVNEAFSDKESGARKDFEAWGLAFKDAQGNALGATDAMLELAGSLETVSKAEALARIKKLGIEDAATIELLLRGRKEVERFISTQKDMGVVTEAQAKITRDYYEALGQFGNRLTSLGNQILATFLPAVTKALAVLSQVVDWATDHQDLVVGFFVAISGAITAWALPALWKMAVATTAAVWPYALLVATVVALAAAFALAYEDFKAWSDGQPSILGKLLGDYKAFVDQWQWLFDGLSWDWEAPVISFDPSVLEGNVERAKAALASVGDFIKEKVGGAVDWVITKVKELLDLIAGIPAKLQAAAQAIPVIAALGAGPSTPTDMSPAAQAGAAFGAGLIKPPGVAAGQNALGAAGNTPGGLAAPNTTNNTSVNVGTVNVNTQATDAAGIAKEVRGALKNELSNAAAGFDDGVDR